MLWRYPVERSDVGSNGGRMTATEIPTQVKNNIWPDVPQSERTAGSIIFRKVFVHIANADELALVRPRLFVETYTPGDDSVVIAEGTMDDTQATMAITQWYGSGDLNAPVLTGASDIDVMTEDEALDYFKAGMLIRISDKTAVDQAGSEEYHTIASVSAYTSDVITLTLSTTLANDYAASGATRVASVVEPSDITASASAVAVVSGNSGVYDDTTYPVVFDGVSSIEQDWTLTFDQGNGTDFTLTSSDPALGISIVSNISSTLQPNNPDFGTPYFALDQAGYSGTFQVGDTIDFTTHAAAISLWYKRDIPAGANSLTGDKVIIGLDGESA